MPSFDTNAAISTTVEKSKDLANTLFKRFADQGVSDTKDFLQRSRDGIEFGEFAKAFGDRAVVLLLGNARAAIEAEAARELERDPAAFGCMNPC